MIYASCRTKYDLCCHVWIIVSGLNISSVFVCLSLSHFPSLSLSPLQVKVLINRPEINCTTFSIYASASSSTHTPKTERRNNSCGSAQHKAYINSQRSQAATVIFVVLVFSHLFFFCVRWCCCWLPLTLLLFSRLVLQLCV